MTLPNTRCKQCINSDKTAVQEPCNKCAEVQFTRNSYENHFLDASKNLMSELPNDSKN